MNEEEDIKELQKILYNLAIESARTNKEQQRIQKELHTYKERLSERQRVKARSTAQPAVLSRASKHRAGKSNSGPRSELPSVPVVDRNGVHLKVGDRVYLLTKGVFKSRRGVITELAAPLDLCTVLDNDGIEQSRKSTNLLIETADTLKYLEG